MEYLQALVDSQWWELAGWVMLHFLWMGTLVGVCVVALLNLMAKRSAEARYAVALAGLGLLSVGPVVIAVGLWPSSGVLEEVAIVSPLEMGVGVVSDVLGAEEVVTAEVVDYSEMIGVVAKAAPWVWLLGSPVTFLMILVGLGGVKQLHKTARELGDGEIADVLGRLMSSLGMVKVSERISGPMLVGIVKPVILLPASILCNYSAAQIEMILLHELAHIRRHDNLVNLMQRLIEATLFFHPAIWILSGRVRLEREHCCDAFVIAYTQKPEDYAYTLASFANTPEASPAFAQAFTRHPLAKRIRQILNVPEPTMTLSRFTYSFVAAIALCLIFLVTLDSTAQGKPDDATIIKNMTQQLNKLTEHMPTAFGVGPKITRLDPELGLKIIQDAWPQLANLKVKTGVLKAFAFSKGLPAQHPQTLQVLYLGLADDDSGVRNYAASYLKPYAHEDFTDDQERYLAWHKVHGQMSLEELKTTAQEKTGDALIIKSMTKELVGLTEHMPTAFGVGPKITRLDPELGLKIIQNAWPQLANLKVKTGVLKAFAFSKGLPAQHPQTLQVLYLGLADDDSGVRNYAASYLKPYAHEDFTDDQEGYLAWHKVYGQMSLEELQVVTRK